MAMVDRLMDNYRRRPHVDRLVIVIVVVIMGMVLGMRVMGVSVVGVMGMLEVFGE